MKSRAFWPVFVFVVGADFVSKWLAAARLSPVGTPHRVVGNVLRLTLSYNRGAAMGLPLGSHVSIVLGVVGLAAVGLLFIWYRRTPENRVFLPVTLGLLAGGALGNAWQRLLSPSGVVDFIDVGLGAHRFWTFNVADSALTVGVVLLLFVFPREEGEQGPGATLTS